MTTRRDEARMGVPERLHALETTITAGEERLPAELTAAVRAVLDRAGQRQRLATGHTVVALAGATGGGKSSLFNAIAGMDVSRVGVRRPTTAEPLACVWGGDGGVASLLEWLGVPPRLRISHGSVLAPDRAGDLDGLVLLDLPDHDSTEFEHRVVVDRLVEMVDVFVWVLDPQKYADAALHERYLRPLSSHRAVTVVVLNQIDKLTSPQVAACELDLRRLLDDDGLGGVAVVPLSARTGEGVDELIQLIKGVVTERHAAEERIAADIAMSADLIVDTVGAGEPGELGDVQRRRLVVALSDALGVEVFASAAARSYLRRARAATGWPVTRWVARLRRDPLVRLGAVPRRRDSAPDAGTEVGTDDSRIMLPPATAAQRARCDTAIRELGDVAAGSLPEPWRDAIRIVAADSAARVPAALDESVASTDIDLVRSPRWWTVANVVQWLALAAAAVGAVWLLALAGASFLRFDVGDPTVGGFPVPTLLLVGGVVMGILVAAGCVVVARYGSRRASARVGRGLREVVDRTAADVVWLPLQEELERYRTFRRALVLAHAH